MDGDRTIIEDVKAQTDIVAVIDRYVKLKQAGKNFTGLCPFHNEKTPSFSVNPDFQIFKCFGCGKSGDVITFVQEIETLDFTQALEKLAKEAGIEIKKNKGKSKYAWLNWLNTEATDFYTKQLNLRSNSTALKYLNDRGIGKESLELFKIGYAPKGSPLLKEIKTKSKNRLTKKQLLQSGLFTEKNGVLRDKFINRIVFPIWSISGQIIGFSGRQTPDNEYGPKYLNTPETPVFHKSSTLLGIYHAKNYIRKDDLAVFCEGNLDVISAHKIGIQNTVAPMGTAITKQQLEIASRYSKNVLFFFDSDKAGQQAVERGFKLAMSLGLNVYAATPSPYQDIDDMIQANPQEAQERVEQKTDAFTYLLLTKSENMLPASNLDDRNTLINYVNSLLEDSLDKSAKDFFRNKAKEILKIDIPEVQKSRYTKRYSVNNDEREAQKANSQACAPKNNKKSIEHISEEPLYKIIERKHPTESYYLKAIIQSSSLSQYSNTKPKLFNSPEIKKIFEALNALKNPTLQGLLDSDYLENKEKELLKDISLLPELTIKADDESIQGAHNKLKLQYINDRIAKLRQLMIKAEQLNQEEKVIELGERINKLAKARRDY